MTLRGMIFGDYNTASDWGLTMREKTIAPPTPKTNYVSVPGRDGDLDTTESLDGVVNYKDRPASFTFILTEGTHADRVTLLTKIQGVLHGQRLKIVDPDDYPDYYFTGRLTVVSTETFAAYAVIKLTGVFDPWRIAEHETIKTVNIATADGTKTIYFSNRGYKILTPTITVSGTVTLGYGTTTRTLTSGSYRFGDLRFSSGVNSITLSGNGSVTITYREAIF